MCLRNGGVRKARYSRKCVYEKMFDKWNEKRKSKYFGGCLQIFYILVLSAFIALYWNLKKCLNGELIFGVGNWKRFWMTHEEKITFRCLNDRLIQFSVILWPPFKPIYLKLQLEQFFLEKTAIKFHYLICLN